MFYNKVVEYLDEMVKESNLKKYVKEQFNKGVNLKLNIDIGTRIHGSIKDTNVIVLKGDPKGDTNITDFNVEDIKNIGFPFDNFFIECEIFSHHERHMGIHVVNTKYIGIDNENSIYICMYMETEDKKGIIPYGTIINIDKLPRFYINCPNTGECKNFIKGGSFSEIYKDRLCIKTQRTSDVCQMAQLLKMGIQIVLYTLDQFNKPKQVMYVERELILKKHKEISTVAPKKSSVIIVNTERKVYKKTERNHGDRNSPKPHVRRGHPRHYKNGKTIWIKQIQIGDKDKNKKHIYSIE